MLTRPTGMAGGWGMLVARVPPGPLQSALHAQGQARPGVWVAMAAPGGGMATRQAGPEGLGEK
jgi:hypothetical protein